MALVWTTARKGVQTCITDLDRGTERATEKGVGQWRSYELGGPLANISFPLHFATVTDTL